MSVRTLANDIRVALREKDVRHGGISREGNSIEIRARDAATLEAARFIRRHDDGAYGMGSRLLQLGLTALSTSLYQVAEPHLRALAEATGETANLGVRNEDGGVMYLRQVESRHAIRHATWVGGHCRVRDADGTLRQDPDGALADRTMMFRKDQVQVAGDWDAVGLRGAGRSPTSSPTSWGSSCCSRPA